LTRSSGDSTAPAEAGPLGRETPGDSELTTRMLVLGAARHGGVMVAAEAFAVAETCGRSSEQVRSCLRRLVGEGLFAREGVGQRAVYTPTEAGHAALEAFAERTRLAFRQDRAREAWDRRWRLVAFAVPETQRTARDALRDHLGRLGGAPVQGGLYVSPHAWGRQVAHAAERLGVATHLTQATTDQLSVGGVSDPVMLAARLWPVERVADRYRTFVCRWSLVPTALAELRDHHRPLPDRAYLPGAIAMALAYSTCFDADPLLPPEMLPQPWPGREARDLLFRSRRLALALRDEHEGPALFRAFDPPEDREDREEDR
jgi:phenylacetic acid degradation operon negative regulatory protein